MPKATFFDQAHFTENGSYQLLPFRFMDLDGKKLVVNEVGEHLFLDPGTLHDFVHHRLDPSSPQYLDLKSKHFLMDGRSALPLQLLATKYRTKKSFLAGFTGLHIFVVTLRCDHSCHYCQVSRVSQDKSKYDMSVDSADRAINLLFRSPSDNLKVEFQGGEPLLNFPLIRHITESVERRAESSQRNVEFVVTTNLAFLDDSIITYLRDHHILVSTSLDGPAFVHNANRPRPGNDSYELAVQGIGRARELLGRDRVAALMTTTRLSLDHPEAIVDEYVRLGFSRIFLRPISPYGFALKTKRKTGYEGEAFLVFYKRALDHIVELGRQGVFLVEEYAQILLTKILTPFPTGYVDLQSPSGAGIGTAVYNYDGDVYLSDEARMLAEMGDRSFRLGNLHNDTYEAMFGGAALRRFVNDSVIESLPGCSDCAFQAYCGIDPLENHATQGDVIGHRPTSQFHQRNLEIIKHLLRLYHGPDPFVKKLFWSWVQNRPVEDLVPAMP